MLLLSRQAWAFLLATAAGLAAVVALVAGRHAWALIASAITLVSWYVARLWNARSPAPFPFALRLLLHLPRPFQGPRQLVRVLQPKRGEWLLEVGPGVGTHALPIARAVMPGGVVSLLDVQQTMLQDVRQRARAAGLANVTSTRADGARLPFVDGAFDGAYMMSTLGEIPDGDGALRELRRVLKPRGRLVVGEICVDPDFVTRRDLRRRAEAAGFRFDRSTGTVLAYVARFDARR